MVWYDFFLVLGNVLKQMFANWLSTIFVIPLTHVDMLWVLVPVWLGWILAEIFQEKKGTSIGNAVSNAAIILWGSVDCARQTSYWMSKNTHAMTEVIFRFSLVALIFAYGVLIVWLGIKGRKRAGMFGRARNVTYVFVMFVPVFYGAMPLTLSHILSTILFFPIFYYVVEFFNKHTPDSRAIIVDSGRDQQHSHLNALQIVTHSNPNHQNFVHTIPPQQNYRGQYPLHANHSNQFRKL